MSQDQNIADDIIYVMPYLLIVQIQRKSACGAGTGA